MIVGLFYGKREKICKVDVSPSAHSYRPKFLVNFFKAKVSILKEITCQMAKIALEIIVFMAPGPSQTGPYQRKQIWSILFCPNGCKILFGPNGCNTSR